MFGLQWFRLKWFNSESSINCYYFYTCAYLILFVLSGLPLLFPTLCFQLPCPHPALPAWKCCELKRNKCMWQNVRVLKCHSGDSRHWFLPGLKPVPHAGCWEHWANSLAQTAPGEPRTRCPALGGSFVPSTLLLSGTMPAVLPEVPPQVHADIVTGLVQEPPVLEGGCLPAVWGSEKLC